MFHKEIQTLLDNFKNLATSELFITYPSDFYRSYICVMILMWRFKGDKELKKCLESLAALQIEYFDKLPDIIVDKKMKKILAFNMFILFANVCTNLYWAIHDFYEINRNYVILMTFVEATIQNIVFHHSITLYYINQCFINLNNELQKGRVDLIFGRMYVRISLILEKVNATFGPYIFCAILCSLLSNALFFNAIILILIKIPRALLMKIPFLTMTLCLCINIYLYYFICEQLCQTMKETDRAIMEHNDDYQNYEIERFTFVRLTLRRKINICGMFHLDLNSLFQLVVEIFLAILLLTQITLN
ncbi:hypothetical protein CVS40_5546 [Lucilia cuprina]|nr:hypothetical protein CVS40_5546 [Lucilia cuprina]